jgi:hypothetical protein
VTSGGEGTDQGLDERWWIRGRAIGCVIEMSGFFSYVVRRRERLVETRRLELLTLSLQRRCSAN